MGRDVAGILGFGIPGLESLVGKVSSMDSASSMTVGVSGEHRPLRMLAESRQV